MRKKPLTYYQKQNLKQPLLKIGSKVENLSYTDKNIDPNLNYFNKYLNQEEHNKMVKMQKERAELGYLAKTFEQSHMENPNLINKKIDVDKISGKIGQENKEENYNKYINQKTNIYNSTLSTEPLSKPNIRSINYHGYNIINNMILGFCDPGAKFPKTSYQNNYEGKQLPKEVENLSPEEYQDYIKFRNEQLNLMSKEREMKGSLGNNMKEIVKKRNLTEDEKKRLILQQKMLREQEYQNNVQLLAQEQRNMNKAQINLSNKRDLEAESQRQYDLYMQQQKLKENVPNEEEQYLKMKKEQEEYERYQKEMMNQQQQQQQQMSPEEIEYYRQMQQQREYERYMYEQEMMKRQQEKLSNINNNINEKKENENQKEKLSKEEEEAYKKEYEKYLLQQQQLNNQNNNNIPIQQNSSENKLTDKEYMNYLNDLRNKEMQQEQNLNENIQYPSNNVPYKEILPENSQIPIKQKTPADIEREKRMQQLYYEQQQRQQEELLMQQQQQQQYQMQNPQAKSEEEYLKKIKNYEDIIQNQPIINKETHEESLMVDPSLHQKQMEHINKLNMQYQGAEVGQINPKNFVSNNPYTDKNYTLGSSNLQQNPITHPINSYKFDYNRLYNPLSFKRQESGKRLQGYGNNIINK